jgi:hypothetical protein
MKHFEREASVSAMARVALEGATTSRWVDEVFAAHRQRQYPRELLFSTVVEVMTLVSLGLSPSLYAAATTAQHLPVLLAALYDKVNRTEPAILRALVQGSAQHPACPADVCVCSTAIIWRPARNGWRLREQRGGIRRYAQRDRGEPLAVPAHDRDIVGPCAPAKAMPPACADRHGVLAAAHANRCAARAGLHALPASRGRINGGASGG